MPPPLFLVLSGPSGVGKDALLHKLKERGDRLHIVVTATTRPPREGEQEAVDYYFFSEERFQQLVDRDDLLEWAEVYGHRYGVPRASVRQGLDRGLDTIVRTDIQGAATIRSKVPEVLLVFLVPPSMESLAERLRLRAKDAPEVVHRRLEEAHGELRDLSLFDYAIVNEDGKLDACAEVVEAIMTAERHRVGPRRVKV